MKLNLGCGHKHLEGYVNVDVDPACLPDVDAELGELPFPDDSVDEILAVHVFEHIWKVDVPETLREWKRCLKPGGLLVLELPCLDKIIRNFVVYDKPTPQLTTWGLFGDPDTLTSHNVYALHKHCYSYNEIVAVLRNEGFKDVAILEPNFHVKVRDMRIEGHKPNAIRA